MTKLLCTDEDPELFFPPHHSEGTEAKKVCARCDFRNDCLRDALDNRIEFGVWGGLNERERARMLNAHAGSRQSTIRTLPPTPHERCGTYSGSQRHRKLGERFCDGCRDAKNTYETARKRRKREAARLEMTA